MSLFINIYVVRRWIEANLNVNQAFVKAMIHAQAHLHLWFQLKFESDISSYFEQTA
jgi:hypothetical protein